MKKVVLGRIAVFAFLFAISSVSKAAAATLVYSWDPSPEGDVIGYRVSYGSAPGRYGATYELGANTSFTLAGLNPGQTVYFVVQAEKAGGVTSEPSEELAYRIEGGSGGGGGGGGAALSSRSCSDWDTRLSNRKAKRPLRTVLEVRNNNALGPEAIRIQLLAANGAALRTDLAKLAPLQQLDYLLDGRIPEGQTGTVCVDHSDNVDGAMTWYYEDQNRKARKRSQFALAMPFGDGRTGAQVVTLNTFEPSRIAAQQALPVLNRLMIRNSDAVAGTGKIDLYDISGTFLTSLPVSLAPGARWDFDLPQLGGSFVGSAIFRPDQSSVRFVFRNVRFLYDNAQWAPSFLGAVSVDGQSPASGTRALVVHTVGRTAVVEVVNTLGVANTIQVSAFRVDGALLSAFPLDLAAGETRHVLVDGIVGGGALAQLVVDGGSNGGFAAFGLEYGFRPNGEISMLTSSNSTTPVGLNLRATYNTFLGQSNLAFIGNNSEAAAAVTIALATTKGPLRRGAVRSFVVAPHATAVVEVGRLFRGSGSGTMVVQSPSSNALFGFLQRQRGTDYSLAVPIRDRRD